MLLAGIIVWVYRHGVLFQRISLWHILPPVMASAIGILLGAEGLRCITAAYKKHLRPATALYISAMGTLGNSMGGLPIGTTFKYVSLSRKAGLTAKETTVGLLVFTVAMVILLTLTAAVSIWATSLPYSYKLTSMGMALLIAIAGLWLYKWLRGKNFWKQHVAPFFQENCLSRVFIISLLTTTIFIVNFCLIGVLLFPELPLASLIFISALGALVGQGSMIQSVGGIQEFVMGLSALLTGFGLLDGVQIALVSRAASIISSGTVVIYLHFAPGNTGAAARNRGGQDRNET